MSQKLSQQATPLSGDSRVNKESTERYTVIDEINAHQFNLCYHLVDRCSNLKLRALLESEN